MKGEKLEVKLGSGNVFRDLGHRNADAEQFKAILAAEIIKVLDREGLSVRAAHGRTGIAAADFSRIRNADLGRFTGLLKQPGARRRRKQPNTEARLPFGNRLLHALLGPLANSVTPAARAS
jgi:hypothetical protein